MFLGKIDDALKNLEQYVVVRPNGDRIGRVYWLMGECYIRLKEYQNADIAISTAVYYEQNNALWWAAGLRTGAGQRPEVGIGRVRARAEAGPRAVDDAQRGKDSVDKKLKG